MQPSQLRVILDARGLMLHAYHAGTDKRPLKGKDKPINTAAHGLANFIEMYVKPVLANTAPINVIAVWEGGNDRRRILLPQYKEKPGQEDSEPVMKEQVGILMNSVKKLLAGLGALQVQCPTVEADDTIAYLCERLQGPKLVYTVDNDLLQLKAYPDTEVVGKIKSSNEYKGYPVWMVAMFKSIVGDPSDGYIGVSGLGETKFKEIVDYVGHDGIAELERCVASNNYTALEEALAAEDHPHLRKLYESRDQWRLSYVLARLHPEWCEYSFGDKLVRPIWYKRLPSRDRVVQALSEAHLTDQVPDFMLRYLPTQTGVDNKTQLDFASLKKQVAKSPIVGFDYESYDSLRNPAYQEARAGYVDVLSQRVTGASYCFGDNLQHTIYASLLHRDTHNLDQEQFLQIMEVMLSDKIPVAQNCKFEQVLSKTNFDVEFEKIYDTAILASYVDEEMEQGLKYMSKKFLNYDQTTYRQVVPEGKDMRDISLDEVLHYGCDDAFVTAHLFVLFKTICECERTWDFIDKYEVNFDYVFMKSFITGIPMNLDYLKKLEMEDDQLYEKIDGKLRAILTENCSDYNQKGFEQMWEDLREFYIQNQTEKAAAKGEPVSQDEIDQFLEEKRAALWEATRYQPLSKPTELFTPFGKRALSLAAKSLGLPGIRVVKPDKLIVWCEGIREQSKEKNIPLNAEQEHFLSTLYDAAGEAVEAGETSVFFHDHLEVVCQKIIYGNKELYIGDELNVDSPKQVAELIYGKMALPILVRNEDKKGTSARTRYDMEGAPGTGEIPIKTILAEMGEEIDESLSMSEEEEDALSWQARVLYFILKLRGINTRRELYYHPYPLLVSPVDNRIHPGIRNCGTKTRRPSSSTPNILQVSKKGGALIRGAFLPLPEDVLGEPQVVVSIDFVQQELVIMAGESGDVNLRACYVGDNKLDVHSSTASALLKMTYEDFLKAYKAKEKKPTLYRKKHAKIVNFLTAYGGSVVGLSRKAIVPKEQAQEFLDAFFERYPKVKEYQERMETLAIRHGFVTDCFGVRKHVDGIYSDNKRMQRALARQAGNHPIQNGAASVLKKAITNIRESGLLERTRATLYAPIYDEIVGSVPISSVVEYVRGMEQCMEIELPGLDIGLKTSVSLGRDWKEGSLNEIGENPSEQTIAEALKKLGYG